MTWLTHGSKVMRGTFDSLLLIDVQYMHHDNIYAEIAQLPLLLQIKGLHGIIPLFRMSGTAIFDKCEFLKGLNHYHGSMACPDPVYRAFSVLFRNGDGLFRL